MALVSVLLPVRDGQRFVDAAVRTVLCASAVELVVVDDGSVDATPSILAGWAARDARVRVITLGAPAGAAAARNRGLKACTGEFVSPRGGSPAHRLVRRGSLPRMDLIQLVTRPAGFEPAAFRSGGGRSIH